MTGIHTQEDNKTTLFCSTDRENCCTDKFNNNIIPGSWFSPNESKILINSHIALGDQTVGLNLSPSLPSGLYHCEMMDRDNVTHHLYAGIYHKDEGMQCMLKIIILILCCCNYSQRAVNYDLT